MTGGAAFARSIEWRTSRTEVAHRWTDRAACTDGGTHLADITTRAEAVSAYSAWCAFCPARDDCRAAARATPWLAVGLWGGLLATSSRGLVDITEPEGKPPAEVENRAGNFERAEAVPAYLIPTDRSDRQAAALRLLADGYSPTAVGRALGVTRDQVNGWRRRAAQQKGNPA